MLQFAFLLAVIFGGIAILTPIVGLTTYFVLRPWLNIYAARQNAPAVDDAYGREDRRYITRQNAPAADDTYARGNQR